MKAAHANMKAEIESIIAVDPRVHQEDQDFLRDAIRMATVLFVEDEKRLEMLRAASDHEKLRALVHLIPVDTNIDVSVLDVPPADETKE